MYICKIVAGIKEDFEFLREYVSKYPVKLCPSYDGNDEDVPIFYVGWSFIKNKFKNQNILDKSISENIEWGFSRLEKEEGYNEAVENFINKSVKNWLPKNFILFDSILQKKPLQAFVSENINLKELSYLYFNKGALYINNCEKNYIINIKSLKIDCDDYKNVLTGFLNIAKNLCLSYKNIANYVDFENLRCVYTFENIRWVKYGKEIDESYFNIIPGFDTKKYIPFIMSKVAKFELSDEEKKSIKRSCERDKITQWLSLMKINISKGFSKKGVDVEIVGDNRFIKVPYSNKRALTGRIMATGSYNPQTLDKKTTDREEIISRFKGGKIVVFDYISFETRIALYFSEDKEFIEKFKNEDLHLHTAKIIFGNAGILKESRELAKSINHRIIFGSSKNAVIQMISYLGNPEEIYYTITEFLKPIIKKAEDQNKFFKENGYVINPWGSIIRPEKDWAAYNNYIQSSATEIIVDQLYRIKEFLKPYQSQLLFQVYDSLVFDVCPGESTIIKDLAKLIMFYKDMPFNITYSNGFDYKNLSVPVEVARN